jgi:hypothetical protein
VSANANGALALVASTANAGREYGAGKEIETCDLAHETCAPIPNATIWNGKNGSAVSLDPAWSPTGSLLAYVKAPTAHTGGNPPVAWYAAHELFVYDPATRRSTKIAGVAGVSVPTWSADGKTLLYVSRNALWLAPATGGKPTEIATPLFAPAEWLNPLLGAISYYGQIPWTAQFSWRSP